MNYFDQLNIGPGVGLVNTNTDEVHRSLLDDGKEEFLAPTRRIRWGYLAQVEVVDAPIIEQSIIERRMVNTAQGRALAKVNIVTTVEPIAQASKPRFDTGWTRKGVGQQHRSRVSFNKPSADIPISKRNVLGACASGSFDSQLHKFPTLELRPIG